MFRGLKELRRKQYFQNKALHVSSICVPFGLNPRCSSEELGVFVARYLTAWKQHGCFPNSGKKKKH